MTNRDVSSVPVHPPTVSACLANWQRCPPLPILWPHGMEENEPHSGQTSPEPHHGRLRAVVSLPEADTQTVESNVVVCNVSVRESGLIVFVVCLFLQMKFLISQGLC